LWWHRFRSTSADPVSWPWTDPAGPISRVCELTSLQRQAAAADALREARPQALEFGDALIDPLRPASGEPGPVGAFRHSVPRKSGELGQDFIE